MINTKGHERWDNVGNIACAIIEIVEMIFFGGIFLKKREIKKKTAVICFLFAVLLNVSKLYFNLIPEINLMLSVCLCISVIFVFFKPSIKNGLFAAVIFIIVAMLSETLAQYMIKKVLGIAYNEVSIDTQQFFAPLSIAVNIIILLYCKKIHKKQLNDLPLRYTAPIMMIPIVTLMIILIFDRAIALADIGGEEFILPFVMMLLYINFITFDFIDNYTNKIMLENANEIIRIDKENYKLLENNEMELRDLRHDIRKHMQIITQLKNNHSSNIESQLEKYIDNLQDTVNKITSVTYTGNEVLDSILNIKGRKAKIQNIKYFVKSNISANLMIHDMDITTILCNALDNAIEASGKTEEAVIVIFIESNIEQVHFLIENTSKRVEFDDGEIKTTKRDKKNHGYGLHSIKQCVKKYNGSMKISYDYGVFTIDIKMDNKIE